MVPDLLADSSTCTLASVLSLAANALNIVAFVTVPLAVIAFSVLPCKENVTFSVSICSSVNSPSPLNVYFFPSSVVI